VGTVLVWNQIHFASVMADVKDIKEFENETKVSKSTMLDL